MTCTVQPLLEVMPRQLRREVDRLAPEGLQEIRLRLGRNPELVMHGNSRFLDMPVTREDLGYVLNAATRYSPWAAKSMHQGYVTIKGGHRIGIAGDIVHKGTDTVQLQNAISLCIRVSRDIPGLAEPYKRIKGSLLILGAPGWGKTTLLRDFARFLSESQQTAVIDDRGELFPEGYQRGKRMDVLSFCPKKQGIDMAVRNLRPENLVVDEITQDQDCEALLYAAHCGVRLVATAHAGSLQDLLHRRIYRPLVEQRIFDSVLVLKKDRSCKLERMSECT